MTPGTLPTTLHPTGRVFLDEYGGDPSGRFSVPRTSTSLPGRTTLAACASFPARDSSSDFLQLVRPTHPPTDKPSVSHEVIVPLVPAYLARNRETQPAGWPLQFVGCHGEAKSPEAACSALINFFYVSCHNVQTILNLTCHPLFLSRHRKGPVNNESDSLSFIDSCTILKSNYLNQ